MGARLKLDSLGEQMPDGHWTQHTLLHVRSHTAKTTVDHSDCEQGIEAAMGGLGLVRLVRTVLTWHVGWHVAYSLSSRDSRDYCNRHR